MAYSSESIYQFLRDYTYDEPLHPNTDLYADANIRGRSFHDMIEEYAAKFHVDISNYIRSYHSDENLDPNNELPLYTLVHRIPVTPQMLLDYANDGRWNLNYPEGHGRIRFSENLLQLVGVLGLIIGGITMLVKLLRHH